MPWSNSNSLELITRPKADRRPRRFLVFLVPSPEQRSPLLGLRAESRNFDLAVRFYAAPGLNESLLERAEFVMTGGLSKFHAAGLFIEMAGLGRVYDGCMFLDGDLEFDETQLSNFLSFVHAAGLDLAQPSVTRDSYCYWKMAYHQPGYIFRETSFVEVMAPYVSRAALSKMLPTFKQSISTYGLDLVWPSLIGSDAIGVVDAFQVRHQERVNHESGGFYKYLRSINVDLDEEERRILAQYGVTPEHAHSRRGYFWKKAWPLSGRPAALHSVLLPGIEKATEKQMLIDLVMRFAAYGRTRSEGELANALRPFLIGENIAGAAAV